MPPSGRLPSCDFKEIRISSVEFNEHAAEIIRDLNKIRYGIPPHGVVAYRLAPTPIREETLALRRFVIERDIPAVGSFDRDQLREAAAQSNQVLRQLGPDIQWVESYVADNKTFCIYLAKDEAIIRKHAEISGFPASKITEVRKMIDPTTAVDKINPA